ncbi:MAG: hypothetical protein ACYDIB_06435 [Desulfobulbia bacterium]
MVAIRVAATIFLNTLFFNGFSSGTNVAADAWMQGAKVLNNQISRLSGNCRNAAGPHTRSTGCAAKTVGIAAVCEAGKFIGVSSVAIKSGLKSGTTPTRLIYG